LLSTFLEAAPTPTQRNRPDQTVQRGRPDPIGENLFPPDLVMQAAPNLDLTEDQKRQLQDEVRQMQEQVPDLQVQLKAENEKLADLLKMERLEETAVLTQADKCIDTEREIKRAQLSMMIRIKNLLTEDQQKQLKELKAKMSGVQAKMARVGMAVQLAQQEGRDVSAIQDSREELSALMRQGKLKEAEELLDKVLEKLAAKK
jgi:Spy/CpxP family protein refolding chaperone